MKKYTISIFFIILSLRLFSQIPYSSSDIMQALKKVNTIGSVLYIAAHPDDENTRLLSYLSKDRTLRTGYLSITRGDGGQNLIGKEQGDLLGLIRTNELLKARSVDGAEQFFTRAIDFGYSKNPDETLDIWSKDSILSDVVWVIRKFKPDVIICRFPTTGEGGHGHHTASAILALEAFDAAADPTKFLEQLSRVSVWKTNKIFWNTFNFGTTNTTAPNQLKLDVGVYNPILGKSYGEIAAESRTMHKSQGFGSSKARGSIVEYFKQLKGDSVKTDLFEGITTTWKRVPGAEKLSMELSGLDKKFNPEKPEVIVPQLVSAYKLLTMLNDKEPEVARWKRIKLLELENLIVGCSGLWLEALVADPIAVPGHRIDITCQALSELGTPARLKNIKWDWANDSLLNKSLMKNELFTVKKSGIIPATFSYSDPYWLSLPHGEGRFNISDQDKIGMAANSPAEQVTFEIEIGGYEFVINRPLVYKFTDPVKGEVYRPFEIVPPVTITPLEKVQVFTSPGQTKKIDFVVKANVDMQVCNYKITVPTGWKIVLNKTTDTLVKKGDEVRVEANVSTDGLTPGNLDAGVFVNGVLYAKAIHRIEYDHIPYQFMLEHATVKLIPIDLKGTGKNIGYIPGAGDDVAECLSQAGYRVISLSNEAIEQGGLNKYDAIITGVRAFNTNNRLFLYHKVLMDYVFAGGNLIVQYNTNNYIGALKDEVGPYPFKISRYRVTDENAKVTFTDPNATVLTTPNKITDADFLGWKQERGIYFASDIDSHYKTFFLINDKGEKPLNGSLITGAYGKGNFVYTGFVFFRELPAGIPGAYRLMANLIALPQNK